MANLSCLELEVGVYSIFTENRTIRIFINSVIEMEEYGDAMAATTGILPSDPTLTTEDPTASAMPHQQPTPQIAPTYNWKLVTEPFKSACGELELGELMHDDMFGLFEAMSAIEMMDPKMDAGMRCNAINKSSVTPGGRHQPLTFWTAQDCGHLPMDVDSTSSPDLIGILDETYACLVTWLEGHSLAQTVFTNLYLHAPWQVKHPLLKAHSVVILKLVDLVKDCVAKGSVYEEEDFQPLVYGFKLANQVTEMRAGGMLREVEVR